MITNNNTLGYDPWKGNPIGRQVAENNAILMLQFQQSLLDYAKRLNEYINASNNWEYRDIEGDYPIATNIWSERNRIPIYKIPGSIMLKVFPDYTWGDNLTFDPNINYYTIRNNKGLYAIIPNNSYISLLMNLSFTLQDELQKALHPTKLASDMTALVSNIPIQHGVVPIQKKPEALVHPLQALLSLDRKSPLEHLQAQNRYNFNNWYANYLKQLQLENKVRDMMTRPLMATNYIRGGLDKINGYDSFLGSFFDPEKHGMWVGPRGRAFLLNHPFVAGLLDLGVDILGAKVIPKIGKSLKPIRTGTPTFLNNEYNLSTLTNRFKNSNWYNFYFGKNEPITITINEPGSNPITTQINKRWPLKTKVMRASSLLRYKKPGTTLTIDNLPGKMVVTEVPKEVITKTKETLLPRIKKLNPNDHGGSLYVIDKMNKVVVIDEDLMNAANGDINGFASVNPKFVNYFPIGIVKPNNKSIPFFTWIHELRHKLQHAIKLSPELKALLEKAYKGIPKGERLAVNTELRTYLLKDMENVPPEILNMFLDKYANNPEVVMDKLEFLNGYGQRYVLNLYRNSHKPNEITNIVQDMINAMKYVPLVENPDKVFEKLPKGVVNQLKIQ